MFRDRLLNNRVALIVCFVSSLTRCIMYTAYIYILFINQTIFMHRGVVLSDSGDYLLRHIFPPRYLYISAFQVSCFYYAPYCFFHLLMLYCLQRTLWLFNVSFIIIVWLQIKKKSWEWDNTLFGNNGTYTAIACVKWKLIMEKTYFKFQCISRLFLSKWRHILRAAINSGLIY